MKWMLQEALLGMDYEAAGGGGSGDEWTCFYCTYTNSGDATHCEGARCHYSREATEQGKKMYAGGASGASGGSGASSLADVFVLWRF